MSIAVAASACDKAPLLAPGGTVMLVEPVALETSFGREGAVIPAIVPLLGHHAMLLLLIKHVLVGRFISFASRTPNDGTWRRSPGSSRCAPSSWS